MEWKAVGATTSGDPYLAWSQATRFAGHAAARVPGARLPVLIRLKRPGDIDSLVASGLIDVPGLYRRGAATHCAGQVPLERVAELEGRVDALEFSWPLSAGMVDEVVPTELPPTLPLVIGVVDRGFAFLNKVFRRGLGGSDRLHTRIACLWDQANKPGTGPWQRPVSVGYGRELDRAAIDALIARAESGEREADLYREVGYPLDESGRLPDELHGTHVADVAAGLPGTTRPAGSAKPASPDDAAGAELILVNLPTLTRGDTTGASPAAFWLDAVRYILERAGPSARIVINLSVGMLAGPHDGSSTIAQALDEIVTRRRYDFALVIAAGNGADRRWSAGIELPPRTAAAATPPDAPERWIDWRLVPGDITDSFVELWFRAADGKPAADVRVCLLSPADRTQVRWQGLDSDADLFDDAGRLVARVSVRRKSAAGAGAMALVSLAPVAGPRGTAPLGLWRIGLCNLDPNQSVRVDAWIQRDEPPPGLDQPVQSSFERTSDGVTVPAVSTISDLACGVETIVVGAALSDQPRERPYSGRLHSNVKGWRDVDAVAPADEGPMSPGLLASGTASGSRFRMSGTSVAAPIVTREIANLLALSGSVDRAALLKGLRAGATASSTRTKVPFVRPGT